MVWSFHVFIFNHAWGQRKIDFDFNYSERTFGIAFTYCSFTLRAKLDVTFGENVIFLKPKLFRKIT